MIATGILFSLISGAAAVQIVPQKVVKPAAVTKKNVVTAVATKKVKISKCAVKDRKNYLNMVFDDKKSESYNEQDSVALRKVEKIEASETYKTLQPIVEHAHELEKQSMEKGNTTANTTKTAAGLPTAAGLLKNMGESMKLVDDIKNMGEVSSMDIKSMEKDASSLHMLSVAAEYAYEVPEVDADGIKDLLKQKDTKLIIVFFAPWCPHCQNYVLYDQESKDPSKAPIELFYKKLQKDSKAKNIKLVKYNVDASPEVPSMFQVPFIPTIYVAEGEKSEVYQEDATDFDTLTKFAAEI